MMGWSDYYEASFSKNLHGFLFQLCSENLPSDDRVEIDGIICITVGNSDKQIVLKIHDVMDKAAINYRKASQAALPVISVPNVQSPKYNLGKNSLKKPKLKPDKLVVSENNNTKANRGSNYLFKNDEDYATEDAVSSSPDSTPPPPPLKPMPQLHQKRLAPAQTSTSRRKQSKPMMVTQIPDDDEEEHEALSTGDIENWPMGSDSEDGHPELGDLSSSMPSLSMFPYSQLQRPPRQRVPLTEELKQGLVPVIHSYECRKCGKKFHGFEQLQVHNMEVHRRYTCNQCETTFSLRCNLRRHERLHAGYKPYQCQWCNKSFSRNGDLKIHEWKHKEASGSGQFRDDDDLQENGLDDNIIVIEPTDVDMDELYEGESKFDEEEMRNGMDMSMKKMENIYEEHSRDKMAEAASVIQLLSKDIIKTVTKDNTSGSKVERIEDHQLSADMVIQSLYGKSLSSSPKALDLAQSHKSNSSPVSKSKKSKNTTSSSLMKSWTSAPTSPASQGRNSESPAPIAKLLESSPKSLASTPPAPKSQHYCVLCKDWWDDFQSYESHCAGIHGRFPCQYCGQTFSNKNNRARHGRSHTGQKQFTCGECGKSFTRSDILREHQIIHTESYHGDQCQYCGTKITTKKADLLAHIKKCIQLNKYSPATVQAKIQSSLENTENAASKLEPGMSLLKFTPGSPFTQLAEKKGSKKEALAADDVLKSAVVDDDSQDGEGSSLIISGKSRSVSNNNMGEDSPPKTLLGERGVLESIPIEQAI